MQVTVALQMNADFQGIFSAFSALVNVQYEVCTVEKIL